MDNEMMVFNDNIFSGKILILDIKNIAYKNIFGVISGGFVNESDKWNKFRNRLLKDIVNIILHFKPNRVIFAIDCDGDNWRKGIYPEYKMNKIRLESHAVVDSETMGKKINIICEEVKNVFTNFRILKIDKCEADDIIAVITEKHAGEGEVVIISADNYFKQLHKYNGVSQYNPIKLQKIEVLNPELALDLKIIIGDDGDNIDGIKRGIGIVKAKKILNEGVDKFLNCHNGTDVIRKYNRNRKLIDFKYIPEEIKKSILDEYNNYQISTFSIKNLMKLFSPTDDITNVFLVNQKYFKIIL